MNQIELLHSVCVYPISVFSLSLETMTTAAIESMQYGRYNYAGVILNGKIYVAGGQSDNDTHLCSVECYDPADGKWTKISNMNHPRANFGLVEQNGMLYAMGAHKSIERYDPVRDVWNEVRSYFKYFLFHYNAVNEFLFSFSLS